jgi:MinD-like ATPase involved in chromosome partitioning or flagellar assembly
VQAATYEAAIASTLRGTYKVGVLGKGGVGKTTVVASVGSIFAEIRRQDRIVAIDADTAFGRLGSRIDPHTKGSYWELASSKDLRSFADVTSRVGSNSAGLYVLAGVRTSRGAYGRTASGARSRAVSRSRLEAGPAFLDLDR